MSERPWTARIARVGVHSMEVFPRTILPTAEITLHYPSDDTVPLTDIRGDRVGTVLHVQMTAHWLYAFGFVTDTAIARGMNHGRLAPDFALLGGRMSSQPSGVRHITAGRISLIRALPNPQYLPGQTALWAGLKFTTESTEGAL